MTNPPNDRNSKQAPDYQELQENIDYVLGKIGLKNTIYLLGCFVDATQIPIHETQKLKITSQYVIIQCIEVFELEESEFFTSGIREYREARMACFHLIRKYSGASHAKIGEHLGLTKRNILYACEKCEERLSVYKSFRQKYEVIERSVIHFISKLNTNT